MNGSSAVEEAVPRKYRRRIAAALGENLRDLEFVVESGIVSTCIVCPDNVEVKLSVRLDWRYAHLCVMHPADDKRCLEVKLSAWVGLSAFSGIVTMLREEPFRYRAWAAGVPKSTDRSFCSDNAVLVGAPV